MLLELRRNVRERVDLSLFDDLRVVYAARMQSKRETFHATLVGHSVPTFCSSGGRAILSCLEDAEVADIIARSDRTPFTPKTLTDPGAIRDKVAEAREKGYALTLEEILIGEIAIGIALPDSSGRPCGAIHLAGSLSEWEPEEFMARFAPLISEAAADICR
ncbi:IclR family transcriptional regulator [Fodinicurvata halophila]|uniref:IclR family transcriptional regulator n=1 Tax=Fodinicurvata halophila TaxID=1419723 RepID=UPI00362F77C8